MPSVQSYCRQKKKGKTETKLEVTLVTGNRKLRNIYLRIKFKVAKSVFFFLTAEAQQRITPKVSAIFV